MISGLKPYPEYKDSGQSWIGSVPKHWGIFPNRSMFQEIRESGHSEEQMLSVTITRGIISQKSLLSDSSKKDSSKLDKSKYKLVEINDIAYNKMRAWQGAIGVSDHRGIISPAYIVVRLRKGINRPKYFHHLYRTPQFAKEAERWSYGITSDMWSLRPEHFKMIYTPEPPVAEQAAIVKFLNWANGQLERAIRAKRKTIGLLNEQKQAIIHRAVTRGLNPNAPLKPSGIPWLGDIPKHWEVRRLKTLVKRNDGGVWGTEFADSGVIVLRSTEQAVDGEWRISSPARIILPDLVVEKGLLEVGDILITKSSGSQDHIGKASLVTKDVAQMRCCYSNFMQRLRVGDVIKPDYLHLLLNSKIGRRHYEFATTSTTGLGNLTRRVIGDLPLPVPSASEQEDILKYLFAELKYPNSALQVLEREIDLLREYRTRLTADVVTGKLDVREASAKLPDENQTGRIITPEPTEESETEESTL